MRYLLFITVLICSCSGKLFQTSNEQVCEFAWIVLDNKTTESHEFFVDQNIYRVKPRTKMKIRISPGIHKFGRVQMFWGGEYKSLYIRPCFEQIVKIS